MPTFSSARPRESERERWNQKYRDPKAIASVVPDPFLPRAFAEYVLPRFPRAGNALDLAGGAGRHAIWLAQQGWDVTLIDLSEAGVEQARQNAGPLATHMHFVVDDLTHFKAAQTQFDLVMVFFYLERSAIREVVKAVRPGGLFVYKTYTSAQMKLEAGPKNPAHLLNPRELLQFASALRILHYREQVAERATAELVAEREA